MRLMNNSERRISMKRTIFLLAFLLSFCTACSFSQVENVPAPALPSSTSSTTNYSFEDYNILSASCISRTKDEFGYQETWNVTNTSDVILTNVSITVAYCDKNGDIIYTDGRFSDVALQPSHSIQLDSFCEKDYFYSEVTNFSYTPPEKIDDTYTGVDVDLIAKQVDFWTN